MDDKVSVLMSVYIKEQPAFLDASLKSMVEQTHMPAEIVLMKDGPLTPELEEVIAQYTQRYPAIMKVIGLENNVGLGRALELGLVACSHELIARMDSDDISVPDRLEAQVKFMLAHPEVGIVGGGINEFKTQTGDTTTIKILPQHNDQLVQYAKSRCPFNHSTVMFRKSAILAAGSYRSMHLFEDYYLWLRLIKHQIKLANLDKVLLYFRIGNDVIGRRRGVAYMKKEVNFLRQSLKEGLLERVEYYKAVATRAPIRMMPKSILVFLYKYILR